MEQGPLAEATLPGENRGNRGGNLGDYSGDGHGPEPRRPGSGRRRPGERGEVATTARSRSGCPDWYAAVAASPTAFQATAGAPAATAGVPAATAGAPAAAVGASGSRTSVALR